MTLPKRHNGKLPPLPDTLLALCEERGGGDASKPALQVIRPLDPSAYSDRERKYVLAALAREAQKVEHAPDGSKHVQLRNAALAMGGFVPILTETEIEQRLYRAIENRAEDKHKALQTIRWGINNGKAKPREVPEPAVLRISLARKPQEATANPEDEEGHGLELREELDVDQLLQQAPYTEWGNAECLAAMYGDLFRYDHILKVWRVWDGNRWQIDSNGEAERTAIEVVRTRRLYAEQIADEAARKKALTFFNGSENTGKRKGLLASAESLPGFATSIDQYDQDDWLVATPNGTLDLLSGTFISPSRRADLITMQLGTHYDPEAHAPRWRLFLEEVFGGDVELIRYIQRAVGYSLTGITREQVLFLCHGRGANGKSTVMEILSVLLGDYAANTPFSTFDGERTSEIAYYLAELRGKRLVTLIENDEDRRLAEGRVKAVTGEDHITCRTLYSKPFSYQPKFKMWLAMNHKPIVRGTDRGIWRRLKLIPFEQNFEGKEDRGLRDVLKQEMPGILNWALEGLQEWLQHGLGKARAIEDATEEYRKESDLVGQWFSDCCASDPGQFLSSAEAYQSFRDWCRAHGFREPTETFLGRNITDKGFTRDKFRGKRGYVGFRILPPETAARET